MFDFEVVNMISKANVIEQRLRDKGLLEACSEVWEHLEDDQSKEIFDLRMKYAVGVIDRWDFPMYLLGEQPLVLPFFADYEKRHSSKDIIIYGAGPVGRYTARMLEKCGYRVAGFCVSNISGMAKNIDWKPVFSFGEICREKDKYIIVIGSFDHSDEIYRNCLWYGDFAPEDVFYPPRKFLMAYNPHQYFDFFEPQKDEVFVDCGVWDGYSSVGFAEWTNWSYDKIYMMEAQRDREQIIVDVLKGKGVKNYDLIMKGAWEKDEMLTFMMNGDPGACVTDAGNSTIEVTSIDSVLKGEKATYIKMDIEGSEYKALLGAKETIRKYAPRLAISVYHKKEDFCVLPKLILDMDDSYHIAYRCYSSMDEECILYAWHE